MNKTFKGILERVKNPKIIIIIGFIGIGLIFLSTVFGGSDEQQVLKEPLSDISASDYCRQTEEKIKGIVYSITGDKNSSVMVTLESGIRYSYADAFESDNSVSSSKESAQESEKKSQSYITVKTADGGEKALIVTEYMPEIKGVAIICAGGDDLSLSEKIENAVTAALNITSKRVYVAGGTVK